MSISMWNLLEGPWCGALGGISSEKGYGVLFKTPPSLAEHLIPFPSFQPGFQETLALNMKSPVYWRKEILDLGPDFLSRVFLVPHKPLEGGESF